MASGRKTCRGTEPASLWRWASTRPRVNPPRGRRRFWDRPSRNLWRSRKSLKNSFLSLTVPPHQAWARSLDMPAIPAKTGLAWVEIRLGSIEHEKMSKSRALSPSFKAKKMGKIKKKIFSLILLEFIWRFWTEYFEEKLPTRYILWTLNSTIFEKKEQFKTQSKF